VPKSKKHDAAYNPYFRPTIMAIAGIPPLLIATIVVFAWQQDMDFYAKTIALRFILTMFFCLILMIHSGFLLMSRHGSEEREAYSRMILDEVSKDRQRRLLDTQREEPS
jgi:hypothetical protein